MTYNYLLQGAAAGLERSTCLEMFGVNFAKLARNLVSEAKAIRSVVKGRFFRGEYVLKHGLVRRPPLTKFERFIEEQVEVGNFDDIVSLIVKGGEKRRAVDDTWVSDFGIKVVQQKRQHSNTCATSAFVYMPATKASFLTMEDTYALRWAGAAFDVGRSFNYPREFSPGAYAAGLVYCPHRSLGEPTPRDRDRVTQTAIQLHRGRVPGEGYAPDVGEVMYVNAAKPELARLRDALAKHATEIETVAGRLIRYRLLVDRLRQIQDDLDGQGLLLASMRPPRPAGF